MRPSRFSGRVVKEEEKNNNVSVPSTGQRIAITTRRRPQSRHPSATNTSSPFGADFDDSDSDAEDSLGGVQKRPALKRRKISPTKTTPAPMQVEGVDPLDEFMNNLDTSVGRTSKQSFDDDLDGDTTVEMAKDVQETEGSFRKKKKLVYEKVDHSKVAYAPFQKNLYIEVPELERMTSEEVLALRRSLGNIRIRGKRCPKPIRSWGQCGLSHAVLEQIRRSGYVAPTPIQAQGIPAIMSGRDVIGVARTGSGKTLAFVLPALRHVAVQNRALAGDGPAALIIAPTRELAIQIFGEAKRFARLLGLRCVCAYGGSGVKDQITELKRGADVVICTPGRIIDLLAMNNGRITNLRRVTFVVLDEADRMFDLGFEPQLTRIVENVRPDRQTVMFSATFPRKVEELARKILKGPVEITVGGNSVAAATIDQHVEVRTEDSKFFRLLELLGTWYEKGSTLVFVDRQESADRIFSDLSKAKYQCLPLHAGRDQADRDSAIADFKNGDVKILVATSVAARGLDVKNLTLVVNYDVPNHYEDYVHRVGRTGRAGNKGTAYTFVTREQESHAPELVKALSLSARNKAMMECEGMDEEERRQRGDEAVAMAVPDELRRMAEGFERKRKAGIVLHGKHSGYGGKGFKFDGNEQYEKEKSKLRKAQAKRFGVEEEGDEDDEESEDEVEVREIGASATTTTPAATPSMAGASTQAVEGVVKATQDKQKFAAELEINDYPQHARWQVTRKNALLDVEEFTACVVTTRGNFYPAGRNPPKGQRKLHLLVEGPSVGAVKSAWREIKRKLEEAASARPAGEDAYSKYSVV